MSHRPSSLARVFAPRALVLALVPLALSLAGCKHGYGTAPLALDAAGGADRLAGPLPSGAPDAGFGLRRRAFYPLAVGNIWGYSIHTRTTIVTDQGPQPPVETDRPWVAQITEQ